LIYLWIKVVHLFAVIAWMVGLFYLPRLFVYHALQKVGSDSDEVFRVMELRLLKVIMRPAAMFALLSGAGLVYLAGYGTEETWLLAKLFGVLGLVVLHGFLEFCARAFQQGANIRTGRFFRILNEVPSLLLLWILVFVVVKPLV
jgi:protoporphyrinogen IX oxidase